MIAATLLAAAPVPSDPQTIGPGDYLTLIGSVLTLILGLITLAQWAKKAFTRAIDNAIETSDGRSVVQVLEGNTKTLKDLTDEIRALRTDHTGLSDRVTRIETFLFPPPGQPAVSRGWFK